MSSCYYSALKPLIFSLKDAESAHHAAIKSLSIPALWKQAPTPQACLASDVAGIHFSGPVGLAAGFDKDAKACKALAKIGFSFIEAGTVTPLPQVGNPKPRLFRLQEDEAIINRMGFNNEGIEAAVKRLKAYRIRAAAPVGLNVGLNKERANMIEDYTDLIMRASSAADYVTVNISSPNTPGLRNLQQGDYFPALLRIITEAQDAYAQQHGVRIPVFVKIAPDMTEDDIRTLGDHAVHAAIDGMIISNTTISRPESLKSRHHHEQGGLSGLPLKEKACDALRTMYRHVKNSFVLIGAGGISDAHDVLERIEAGASLVQLYSAMIYQGPYIAADIHATLPALLEEKSYHSIADAIGRNA